MSTFNLDENQATYQIRAYRPGMIQVNEKTYTKSLLISPTQLIEDWPPQTLAEMTAAMVSMVITLKPDVVLIGTGAKLEFPPAELYGDLINHGIGVEIMDSAAACRTYNALSAENRNVVAALIIK